MLQSEKEFGNETVVEEIALFRQLVMCKTIMQSVNGQGRDRPLSTLGRNNIKNHILDRVLLDHECLKEDQRDQIHELPAKFNLFMTPS